VPSKREYSLKNHHRSIFISDTHLGNKNCQAEKLLSLLKSVECDKLYLVGDIIDVWSMQASKLHWTQPQSEIIRRVLKMSRNTEIYYVVGNHDAIVRPFLPIDMGNIKIVNEAVHTTARGRKLLVTHGDIFDPFVVRYEWISKLGAKVYDLLIKANSSINWVRRIFGLKYWSLSKYIKYKSKRITNVIDNFENLLIDYAKQHGYDGVVAGHIHTPDVNNVKGYYNCGDWVETCSWLSEDEYGNITLNHF
jgi:UDP-2,3-diacylglucosamine pyrophosphatase LpxH